MITLYQQFGGRGAMASLLHYDSHLMREHGANGVLISAEVVRCAVFDSIKRGTGFALERACHPGAYVLGKGRSGIRPELNTQSGKRTEQQSLCKSPSSQKLPPIALQFP